MAEVVVKCLQELLGICITSIFQHRMQQADMMAHVMT